MSTKDNVSQLSKRVKDASKVMKVTEDVMYDLLLQLGIDKDEDDSLALLEAETTTLQDAQEVFCLHPGWAPDPENTKVPVARFKAGWFVLKGTSKKKIEDKDPSQTTSEALLKELRDVRRYKDTELLDEYNPECSTEIIDELNKRSRGNSFLVYNDEELNKEISLEMLRIARRQDTSDRHTYLKNGRTVTVRLLRVGEFPHIWVEESPIHPDIELQNGYCDKCQNTWDGIEIEDRIIVRVAVDCGGIDVDSSARIHELIKKIRENKNANFLLEVPAIQARYDDLKEIERLPVLRRRAGGLGGAKDPFFVVKHRTF